MLYFHEFTPIKWIFPPKKRWIYFNDPKTIFFQLDYHRFFAHPQLIWMFLNGVQLTQSFFFIWKRVQIRANFWKASNFLRSINIKPWKRVFIFSIKNRKLKSAEFLNKKKRLEFFWKSIWQCFSHCSCTFYSVF